MGIVAIRAAYSTSRCDRFGVGPFQDRVSIWKAEFRPLIQVTLEANLRGSTGVDDCVVRSARLVMFAGRAVTRFATDIHGVRAFRLQPRVRGCLETTDNIGVALSATRGTGKSGARDLRGSDDRSAERRARDHQSEERQTENRASDRKGAVSADPRTNFRHGRHLNWHFYEVRPRILLFELSRIVRSQL